MTGTLRTLACYARVNEKISAETLAYLNSNILGKTPGGTICALEDYPPLLRRIIVDQGEMAFGDNEKPMADIFVGICRKPPWTWTADDRALSKRKGFKWDRCGVHFANHNMFLACLIGAGAVLLVIVLVRQLFRKD